MARKDETKQYTVLVSFTDPEDGMTVYWAGKDTYPRAGYAPPDERIAYLQSSNTAMGMPVIAKK